MSNKLKKYKPLLFTTTVRNPKRLKGFLSILKEYDGTVLDNKLIEKITGKIIEAGLYNPTNLSPNIKRKIKEEKNLTKAEILKILKDNPQKHKEAGFDRGWPSRFDTWFKFAKELGCVFYKRGEKIHFSKIGLKLADVEISEISEQVAFLNVFVKYQRNNPFRRVLNENIPLIFLLQVIKKLNADKNFIDTGISKLELPLLIYWKDSDAEKLYLRIKKLRKEHGFSPSWEIIYNICKEEIMEGEVIKRDYKSIMVDYPDELIRKMRLTGLISLRGNGRFIDVNKNEEKKINYILKKYSDCKKFDNEEDYFKYMSEVDKNLISFAPKLIPKLKKEKFLKKWVNRYQWRTIKSEILKLTNKKSLTKDEILKYLSHPVRLEFLIALAVKSKFPDIKVIPNYPTDDEGLPTSTAGGKGNIGDIECFEKRNGVLIEVTMLEGGTQTKMEVYPITRHLEEFKIKGKAQHSMCYFVAPSIYIDSKRKIRFLKADENLFISPKTIKEFVKHLEESKTLYISS